jgi:hypothetical protein
MLCNECKKGQTSESEGVELKDRHRLQYVTRQLSARSGQRREPSQQQLDHRHRRMKDIVNNIITKGTLSTPDLDR